MGSRQIKISVPDSNADVAAWIEAQEAKGPSVVELIRWYVRHFGPSDPRNDVDLASVSIDMSEGRRVPLAARAPVAQQYQPPPARQPVMPVQPTLPAEPPAVQAPAPQAGSPAVSQEPSSGIIHVPGQSTVAETMAARSALAADAPSVQPADQRADEPPAEDEEEEAVAEAPPAPRAKRPSSKGRGMSALMSRSDDDDESKE